MKIQEAEHMIGIGHVCRKPRRHLSGIDVTLITLAIAVLLLALAVADTATRFTAKVNEHREWYEQMQSEIDQLASEQAELAAEVAANTER
jgi:uncharacterized protein YoxC